MMDTYESDRDYCGPSGRCVFCRILTMLVPRRLWGIDLNRLCYEHDVAWRDGADRRDDVRFAMMIFSAFAEAGLVRRGALVAFLYFSAVRIVGRFGTAA